MQRPEHKVFIRLNTSDTANAVTTAHLAGEAILELYAGDVSVEYKEDSSPLTAADRASHQLILERLRGFSDLPVLSEESRGITYGERADWTRFWLVDPLDGTKEFLKRNGEFTVNIALVEDGVPTFGVVYAPVLGRLYMGWSGHGAYRADAGDHFDSAEELAAGACDPAAHWRSLPVGGGAGSHVRVVASRSHQNDETRAFIERLRERHGEAELVSIGSSLKLCLVAEGSADVYPRIAPTMEWDTAAAHALVSSAGGKVVEAESGRPLRYNKENLLNPHFIAYAAHWQE